MTPVTEALQIIRDTASYLGSVTVKLIDALELTLAQDISSPINMPPFNQSAMDGYAVCEHSENEYKIIGEVKAGNHSD